MHVYMQTHFIVSFKHLQDTTHAGLTGAFISQTCLNIFFQSKAALLNVS